MMGFINRIKIKRRRKRKIKRALRVALEDFDRYTILEIMENEEGGWTNGAEPLNNANLEEVRRALDEMGFK